MPGRRCEIADAVGSELRLLGFLLSGFCQAIRDDRVGGRIEGKPNMCAGNLEVNVRISAEAVVPIDDSVAASVDGRFYHRVGHIASQRIEKVAGAAASVASGKYVLTMFSKDVPADGLGRLQHSAMCDSAAERCGQTDHRGYLFWSLSCDGPRQNATETVADEMKLTAGIV